MYQASDIWAEVLSQGPKKGMARIKYPCIWTEICHCGVLSLHILAGIRAVTANRPGAETILPYMFQLDHSLFWPDHTLQSRALVRSLLFKCTGICPHQWDAINTKKISCLECSSQQLRNWPSVPWSKGNSTGVIELGINISYQKCWVSKICVLPVCMNCMLTFTLQWTEIMIRREATMWLRLCFWRFPYGSTHWIL